MIAQMAMILRIAQFRIIHETWLDRSTLFDTVYKFRQSIPVFLRQLGYRLGAFLLDKDRILLHAL